MLILGSNRIIVNTNKHQTQPIHNKCLTDKNTYYDLKDKKIHINCRGGGGREGRNEGEGERECRGRVERE